MSGAKLILKTWEELDSDSDSDTDNPTVATDSTVADEIIHRLLDSKNEKVSHLGRQLVELSRDPTKKIQIDRKLYLLVKTIADAGDPKQHTKLKITEDKYKLLITQAKTGKNTSEEQQVLEEALFAKVCHCVKKRLSSSTAKWLLGEINSDIDHLPYNPYAVFTSSIYNKRGFTRTKSFSECS